MDLTLSEDQRTLQDSARGLLAKHAVSANAAAVVGTPGGYSVALWRTMAELGWNGLATPEQYGGIDAGFVELCLLIEELGRTQIPTPFVTTVCAALTITRFGTKAQQERCLNAIVKGGILSCATEGVSVTRRADELVLGGTAMFVPYAEAADELLVVARDSHTGEPSVLLVAGLGGRFSRLDVLGIEPLYSVDFTGVRISTEQLLDGPDVASALTGYLTAATCAGMVGGGQGVLDMTVAYAKTRRQFGKPIGSFQSVQHHCAEMAVDLLVARLITYEAACRLAEGCSGETEVSLAKSWTSEAYERICAQGHQVHGAIGFTHEYELHWYLRHSIAAALAFGDADYHFGKLQSGLGL